jgi:hypothetical protein
MDHKTAGEKFCELLEVMSRLRGVHGCPWDKEQTHASLKPFLREESHELLDALERRLGESFVVSARPSRCARVVLEEIAGSHATVVATMGVFIRHRCFELPHCFVPPLSA